MERVYNFISLSKFIIPVTHWNGKIDVQQNTNATPSGMPHRDELIGLYLQKKKDGSMAWNYMGELHSNIKFNKRLT
jgi:hypothetical protein